MQIKALEPGQGADNGIQNMAATGLPAPGHKKTNHPQDHGRKVN